MHCGIRPQPRPDMVAATELQKGLPNCFEMRGFALSGPSASSLLPCGDGSGMGSKSQKPATPAKLIAELSV